MAAPTGHVLDSEDDGGVVGEFVISVRSVALNTDLSMMDIDLLHAEVTALRKEVALLQHGISTNSSKVAELNHKDFFSAVWPALCYKTEPMPVLIVPQEKPEKVLNPLLTLKQELGLVPECKAEPYTSSMEEEEEHHIFFKLEPEPVEIMEMCHQKHPAPIPLKTCSVKLVDCRKTLEKNTNSQSAEAPEEEEEERSGMSTTQSAGTHSENEEDHASEDKKRFIMFTAQSAGTCAEGEEHAPEDEERSGMSTTQAAEMCDEGEEDDAPEERLSLEDEEPSFTSTKFTDQRKASVRTEVKGGCAGRTPGAHQRRRKRRNQERNQERLFSCTFCERSFFKRCNLSNHLKVHSRETAPPAHQQQ